MENVYYSVSINDNKFIVLGSSSIIGEGTIDDTLLSWFKKQLESTRKDSFTGVDIVLALIETHPKIYRILYSATIKDAIKQILSLLPTKAKMEDTDVNTVIRDLAKIAKINDFVSGKGYEQKVIEYFRNPEICYKQHVINVLKECAPDVIFKSCYPPFNGKTLKEIGREIESDTPQGREFQEELIRQTLAYMVAINHE